MPLDTVEDQYRSDRNLQDRIDLHSRFSTSPVSFQTWVFQQIDLDVRDTVLEVGCGNGGLFSENLNRLPDSTGFGLTDRSLGMVRAAKAKLHPANGRFYFSAADVTHLPIRSNVFDLAIANHMLYHVEKLDLALSELARVLKPKGRLYAATNGSGHMKELVELAEDFDSRLHGFGLSHRKFGIENGGRRLGKWFGEVAIRKFPDSLSITDVGAVIAYVTSTSEIARHAMSGRRLDRFRGILEERMKRRGAIRVSKDVGLFVAGEPRKDLLHSAS